MSKASLEANSAPQPTQRSTGFSRGFGILVRWIWRRRSLAHMRGPGFLGVQDYSPTRALHEAVRGSEQSGPEVSHICLATNIPRKKIIATAEITATQFTLPVYEL